MEEFIASKIASLLELYFAEIAQFREWIIFGIVLLIVSIPKMKVLVKLPYWKERKIVEYVILNKIEDIPLRCFF